MPAWHAACCAAIEFALAMIISHWTAHLRVVHALAASSHLVLLRQASDGLPQVTDGLPGTSMVGIETLLKRSIGHTVHGPSTHVVQLLGNFCIDRIAVEYDIQRSIADRCARIRHQRSRQSSQHGQDAYTKHNDWCIELMATRRLQVNTTEA
eukprot:TRINITY_DN23482_c0_g1_i1.p1 TRINITY_DN23482_c0_g1~~TRINITY_DN23482_c0_g1_i1.p1  ORF type:complete len:163 (+),score=3.95 TRINITY_DN23482_c0_g1_i1:34-489(+)